jgi:hypothetical protein
MQAGLFQFLRQRLQQDLGWVLCGAVGQVGDL